MAEGFFSAYGGDDIEILSAGLEPGGVNPLAIKVMAEISIGISGHTSNNLNEYLDIEFDYVITVCDNAAQKCPVFRGSKSHPERTKSRQGSRRTDQESHPELPPGSHPEPASLVPSEAGVEGRLPNRVHWPILDPASALKSSSEKAITEDEVLQVFRKIRDEIGQKIKAWLKTAK
ncbi:MAG: arsenate reductase ArsC [candidate division Zixibacteria bacterium]|nr:arsenate reductase ArsC [candidate division Zixibacteria bacterium]